jgi:hypothetical protein
MPAAGGVHRRGAPCDGVLRRAVPPGGWAPPPLAARRLYRPPSPPGWSRASLAGGTPPESRGPQAAGLHRRPGTGGSRGPGAPSAVATATTSGGPPSRTPAGAIRAAGPRRGPPGGAAPRGRWLPVSVEPARLNASSLVDYMGETGSRPTYVGAICSARRRLGRGRAERNELVRSASRSTRGVLRDNAQTGSPSFPRHHPFFAVGSARPGWGSPLLSHDPTPFGCGWLRQSGAAQSGPAVILDASSRAVMTSYGPRLGGIVAYSRRGKPATVGSRPVPTPCLVAVFLGGCPGAPRPSRRPPPIASERGGRTWEACCSRG